MKFRLLIMLLCLAAVASAQDSAQITDSSKNLEIEARFPGGYKAWTKYLLKHIDANVPAKNKAENGRYEVWIQYTIDCSGKLVDIIPLTHLGKGMEEELIRVIKKSPKWIPASQNGHCVKAYRKQVFTFVINNK